MRAVAVSVFVLVTSLATAQVASAQWTISAFIGDAWTTPRDLRVSSLAHDTELQLGNVRYEDKAFKPPIHYGVRVTRYFTRAPWVGLEGEFIHLKVITSDSQLIQADGRFLGQPVRGVAPLGEYLSGFELSNGLNLILANAVARVPLGGSPGRAGRMAVTLRGGIGPTVPHVEGRFQDRVEYSYQWSDPVWQVAGGVEVGLVPWLDLVSELKWTSTHQHVNIDGVDVEGRFRSRQVLLGLSWRIPR